MPPEKFNFTEAYKDIEEINNWFQQEEVDLDKALKKYEEGMELFEKCRRRLKEAENRFESIKNKYKTEEPESADNIEIENPLPEVEAEDLPF